MAGQSSHSLPLIPAIRADQSTARYSSLATRRASTRPAIRCCRAPASAELDLIVAHVRDSFAAAEPIDFNAHVRPIMAQYAQLYPIMSFHLFDLADYDQLVRHRQPLLLAFQRPIEDPNYMPVTRDLSRAKVEAIVAWLKAETGDPTEPLPRGVAPLPHLAAETEATRRRALAEAIGAAREDAKTAAARAFAVKSGVYLNLPFRSE